MADPDPHIRPSRTDDRPRRPGDEPAGTGMPPAGPHATPENTEPEATPGAGALPGERPACEVDPGAG